MNVTLLLAMLMTALLTGCSGHGAHDHDHDHDGPKEAQGAHGGRLLEDGPFVLEVVIFEQGVPPEYRLYPRLNGQPIPPDQVEARIKLRRINGLSEGVADTHEFAPNEDYLRSGLEVYEPHSFDVSVTAIFDGRSFEWTYDSPEGRVDITPEMAEAMKVSVATAREGVIHQQRPLYGRIDVDPERQRRVTARFPGVVRSVDVALGDGVKAGQVLARVESNESLQMIAVTTPISGTVVRREINPGDSTAGEMLFEIVDLQRVWGVLQRFEHDQERVRLGQLARLTTRDGVLVEVPIDYVSPVTVPGAPTDVRVVLANDDGQWSPGQLVTGRVTVSETPVPLVVPLSALQTFRDWDVVFVVEGERYQAQPVELGRRDDTHVEVLSGLEPGARIVVGNAYLIKADIEKSGASHDH